MYISKITVLVIVLFNFIFSYSQGQEKIEFGKPSHQELTMNSFEKDPDAAGVVLYEKGQYTIELVRNYILLVKEVHVKTKVLDASKFKESTINLYMYKTNDSRDKLKNIKAITHNGNLQTYVKEDAYFDIDVNENWSKKRFTFPNIKDGSILEYKYTITTPFLFNLGGWDFQGALPKIYSEFNTQIPANYRYNRALYGSHDLLINESKIKKDCFSLPQITQPGDCEVTIYAMKDIPAFKEEKYMLAKENYIARVDYELMTFYDFRGSKETFSKTWKDVDKEFKYDKDLGKQLNNNSYFENIIPENVLSNPDELEKAKKIYYQIQQHFNWNGKHGMFSHSRVKKAYENMSGSTSEINLSLINALQAANLDAKLVLHSTRENGLPNTSFPVITDFNYVLVYLKIGENDYLLDASDNNLPFGLIPFNALNVQVRVMDFKKGSFWFPIKPHKKNIEYINAQLSINDDIITGNVNEMHTGYKALEIRNELNSSNESNYIVKKESFINDLEINDYKLENKNDLSSNIKETYSINFSPETAGNSVYVFPYFLQNSITENPFKLKERNYLVDIGYPITNTYMITLNLNNKYEVEQMPNNKKIKLMNDAGDCTVIYSNKDGKVNLRFSFKLNDYRFEATNYQNLKDFYNQVIEILTKEPIVLKKI
tara:strand:+ start:5039 stop:7006 length:1968 start_codon:yes stop_codon:yes gene_type:complete